MVMLNANYIDEIKPEDCEYEVVEHLNRSTSLQGYTDPVTEWCIQGKVFFKDEDGEIDYEYVEATVYNWKTGGSTPTDEYQWHVGGHDYEAVDFVDAIIKGKIEPYFNLD